jgi:hypothetical protein
MAGKQKAVGWINQQIPYVGVVAPETYLEPEYTLRYESKQK